MLLLAIGMPLGLASAVLAVLVLVMKFEPALLTAPWEFGEGLLTGRFGSGPLNILAQKVYGTLTSYVLISIPLFIFMAALLERSGIAKSMYDSLNVWLSKTRGGIAIVTSIMAVIMAAMSGIIGGEVVLLGLIALPQMLRLGYNQDMAIGVICASGSLGTMIPPSIVLIIYGLITETSIVALFTAAFLPGFMLASFIIIYIVVRTQLNPALAPLPPADPNEPEPREKKLLFLSFLAVLGAGFAAALFIRAAFFTLTGQNGSEVEDQLIALGEPHHVLWIGIALAAFLALIFLAFGRARSAKGWAMGKGLVGPIVVIGVVMGSIYGGISGITEAAAMGVVAVFLLSLFRGEASFDLVWDSLMRTLKSTGTIIWVTIGAAALAGAYTIAGGPTYVANLIIGTDLPTMGILLVMMLILLIMGAFMDWVGIVLLIIPVFLPIVQRLPIEEIGFFGQLEPKYLAVWFGVLFCMNMQVSFLSPPFGPAAFYLKSVAPPHISLTDIFKGFLPFICLQICALAVLLSWPGIIQVLLD
nr:TRAP transporter large permease subunit [Jannaschia sp. Os4]